MERIRESEMSERMTRCLKPPSTHIQGEKMITFEQIKKANDSIKTTDIKGKYYAEVNQRVKAFRMVYPEGAISTEMLSNENGVCVFKATVCNDSGMVLGTGTAYEKEGSTFINKTSYIENCETSAVGRALGMCGFGIDVSIASYEEVANAIENQNKADPKAEAKERADAIKQINDLCAKLDTNPIEYCKEFGYEYNISDLKLLKGVAKGLEKRLASKK